MASLHRTTFPAVRLVALTAGVLCLPQPAHAQTLPLTPTANTFSTLAGGYSGTYAAGGVCGGTGSGSKYTSVDTLGNGCPLTQAILGPSLSGIGVDGAGNVFVEDYTNGQVRRVDAKSGIVSKVIATSNTVCSATTSATGTKQDALGSGCVNGSALGPAAARGMNVDPWGNVIVGSYNANQINIVCLATSPLCPGTSNRKQVGSFYRIAGCIATQGGGSTAASGVASYTGGDNSLASPYQNLSGDVSAWGLTGTPAATATVGTANATTCSSTSGGVNNARNAQADKYGNVYIADTNGQRYRVVLGPASYNGVTNPLFAIINLNPKYTANEGYIYTILGAFTAFTQNSVTYNVPTASGSACSSASTTIVSNDAFGDGCPFFSTGKPAGASSPAGIGVDKDGNPIFSDNADSAVRVLYVGGATMKNIISVNNGGITPTVGSVYAIAGTGSTTKGSTPQLNVSAGSISTSNTKVAVDGADNIYLSDGNGVNIIDAATGYLRRPIAVGGTVCTGGASNGDGCPPGQGDTYTSLSSVGTAIAVDNLGNLLLADSTGRVRKLLAGTLYPTAVGSTFTQNVVLHEPAGTTGITASLLNASPSITIPSVAPNCVVYTTTTPTLSDGTADCTVPVTFAPAVPGKVGATLSITNIGGGGATVLYPLVGNATGAVLVTDTANPKTATFATFGATGKPTSVAFDSGGNLYSADNSTGTISRVTPAGAVSTVGTLAAGLVATQVAVDTRGNVYVALSGRSYVSLFQLTSAGTYMSTNYSNGAATTPQGVAVDAQGNLYLADSTTKTVYQIPNDAGFANQQAAIPLVSGLANPSLLALDGLGNLLIADTGIVYSYNASTGTLNMVASASAGGIALSGLTPVGLAADAGGNIYIQDSASKKVFEIPYQTYTPGYVTVLSGETTPSGLGVDGRGQVYVADSGLATPAILTILRASETYTFPTATTTYTGVFSNAGNASSTGYAQTDTAEFPYTGTGSGGCGTISGSSLLLTGAACNFSVTPNLGSNGQLVTNTTTLLPATSIGSLALTAQEGSGVTYSTTTNVTGPASAVYLTSGTELSFVVAESSTNNNSQNGESVNVTIGSGNPVIYGNPVAYALNNGQVAVPVSGLTVGNYTIMAVYPGDGTYTASSGSANFAITQASTSVSWTPGTTTQQYSAAVGKPVLNATASSSSQNVPGAFIYTATPNGGASTFIHSASYLPVGSYSLGVTFVPTDTIDYAQSTGSVASYTVTKASTAAPVGASQMLVAADGSGNFTTVQAAVNALPSGGSIYIKPGTYTGDIAVVQPNVALRGLGGDPTQVILTHAGGAFGGSGVYAYAGEFTVATENGSQLPAGSTQFTGDEGSATLVVAKGINTALSSSTTIPNGFYGENFTLVNTYDSDNVTTTTTYLPSGNSGTCTANQGPARTYFDLYNNSLLCASQALAIWTTSDLSVMNNVYTTSLQDTIYTASQGSGSNGYVPARQYWFRGKVTGDVDYIFGDAASVFDNTSIYSAFHGSSAGGSVTIHAQSKAVQTGNSGDYLSGYVMNSDVFTSQSTGMSNLYFGRPYNTYSTWIMLNSYIDQVAPSGYTTGLGPTLNASTYTEFNDIPYTDPATNNPDLNGVLYLGTGGNAGTGVSGPRETSSTNPGTAMAGNAPPTSMNQAQAQAYFPTNFLSQTVSSALSSTQNWIPTTAIAAGVNAFVPSGASATVAGGSSVTLLMRPQTPGLGAVSNGVYTIPTGTYSLSDTYNGATTILASGSLDASGEAYFISSALNAGTHSLSWTYSGDANFSGSSTVSAYTLTVSGTSTSTTLSGTTPLAAGQTENLTATVSANGASPTGSVMLTIDGSATQSSILSGGQATFAVTGLQPGQHSFTASYGGTTSFSNSTSSAFVVSVIAQPTVGSISPTSGPAAGGTSVLITGTNFTGATAVSFGAAAAAGVVVNSATSITATSPAGTGLVDVTVTTAGGTSATSAADQFTYIARPPSYVFVANSGGTVSSYGDSNGAAVTSSVSGGGIGVAVDSNGNVWSIASAGTGVTQFAPAGTASATYMPSGISGASAIAIDGGGAVWLVQGGSSNNLYELTNAGAAVSTTGFATAGGVSTPASVSVDTAGSLWIANSGNNTVTEVIGVGAPVATPVVTQIVNATSGARP